MKAISIIQPWASLIVNGVKDVENRMWSTSYRGPLLIHAGKKVDQDHMRAAAQTIGEAITSSEQVVDVFKRLKEPLPRGGIIGVVDLVDCTMVSRSPWAQIGAWHFVLENPRPVLFHPVRGQLSLFDVDGVQL